jgi:phage-related protein
MPSKRPIPMSTPASWPGSPGCATGASTASRSAKAIGQGLHELRVISRLNTRVLWFFQRGQRIVVHGVRHKGQKLPPGALRTAVARKHDWERRFA